ncbi:hypothetical protein HS088_TW23G01005 [Tripterygium wilfordii]|uniref:Uncharacterized protein n=1 Tax=Tripterygium wilfordii TaxID=458696 RepID=A0A7J7BWK8_TRIWF|nr:uncharacterized protein LOC119993177 [Tripterygium wilfordii]KAF5726263.1 hypothetical protein HS088_TW23G01005 [Tripterygium wilfordii]
MSVAVLNPQDCLKNSVSRQALISPPRKPNPNQNQNQNQNQIRSNRAAQQKRRNRSPNKSPQSRASVSSKLPSRNSSPDNNNSTNSKSQKLVMGQVRILKRGEEVKEAAPIKAKSDLNLGSTERLGPDPESMKNEIRLTHSGPVNGFYAGSAFITSPPPSSLPLPAFFTKKTTDLKYDDATSDLCRILKLNF